MKVAPYKIFDSRGGPSEASSSGEHPSLPNSDLSIRVLHFHFHPAFLLSLALEPCQFYDDFITEVSAYQ